MNEIDVKFSIESPQQKGVTIVISIDKKIEEELLYKVMVGANGTWDTISDFSKDNIIEWMPKEDGKYFILVQGKIAHSKKPFDYISRINYIIGCDDEKLICAIDMDKSVISIGNKIKITVVADKTSLMYRYWIKFDGNWEMIKDYSPDNSLGITAKNSGEHELLVECKQIDSKSNYDDFKSIKFQVKSIKKPEIIDFKCLSSELLVGEEIIFQVEANCDETRNVLYKFIKVNSQGMVSCIQDYCTKRRISFVEEEYGEYKLLCMAKDMYSQSYYDDRAVINFNIEKYLPIKIKSFTSDMNSPETVESNIELKAVVSGGKELLYRFIIDGNYGEDSGYIRGNSFIWKAKAAGIYKITLWVKDCSFQGSYEQQDSFQFQIEENKTEPVVIKAVRVEGNKTLLINETIRVKVLAMGGNDLRYSFIVKNETVIKETIDYGSCNWVDYTPEEQGEFQLEVRVKDKYSSREFDAHSIVHVQVNKFIPAQIDYVLVPSKEGYIAGDQINLNVITQNTSNILVRYLLKINGHKIEESDYSENKHYIFDTKYSGMYTIEIYAKNKVSSESYDCKKEVKVKVREAMPITATTIKADSVNIMVNNIINFTAICEGGKEVLYEFYIMEAYEWRLVQNYSRKNSYSYIPFVSGQFKILVLTKSNSKKGSYEDYDILCFNVIDD